MQPAVTAILTMMMLSPASAGGTKVTRDPAVIARGREIARTQCARCHGIDFNDESPLEQAPPFYRLQERYPIEHLAETFAVGVRLGHKEMPPFELPRTQIEALIAYLGSLERQVGR